MAGLLLVTALAGAVAVVRPWEDTEQIAVPPIQTDDRERRADLAVDALDRLQVAVASRSARDGSELERTLVANASALGVRDFSLRYVAQDDAVATSPDEWVADVATSWELPGFDDRPATTEVSVTFREKDGRAVITEVGGHGGRSPLWLSGPVQVRRTDRTLVIARGSAAEADRFAGLAVEAVTVVDRVLIDWRGRVVVEVADSAKGLEEQLDAEPGEYAQIAAVTTTVDGSSGPDAPVHVFVNPEIYAGLLPAGAQVVMSHEVTHVAVRAVDTTMPLWLVEGFADYVALRDVDLPLSKTAGQIAAVVRKNGVPRSLPPDDSFDTRTTHLGAAYESAWLACRTLAELGGEARLVAFYDAMAGGADQARAIRRVFEFSQASFVESWRERLRDLAG